MKNEILEEVWHNRDAFAREHGYDIDAMVAALQKDEQNSLNVIVDRRKGAPIGIGTPLSRRPSHTTQRTGPYWAVRLFRQSRDWKPPD